MPRDKRSFFERLTGNPAPYTDTGFPDAEPSLMEEGHHLAVTGEEEDADTERGMREADEDEGQLTVDVYQTPTHIIIQSTVAGVKPEDLDVAITQDMITIKGMRERYKDVSDRDYYYQELYWGSFSRSILLPQEVSAEEAEASIKNGLLTVKLPKLDKNRIQKLRIRNE